MSLYKLKGPQSSLGSFRSVFLLEPWQGIPQTPAPCSDRGSQGMCTASLCRLHARISDRGFDSLSHQSPALLGPRPTLRGCCFWMRNLGRLTGEQASDQALCSILQTMGVDSSLTEASLQWANGPPLFQTLSAHQQRFLAALFRAPAFVLKGLPMLYSTRSGTRPRGGIADVLFAAIQVNV